jgi:hypothetical protein
VTEDINELVASINTNQVLVALLDEYKKLTVPTLKFLDIKTDNKELIIDYDDTTASFNFSVRDKNVEQQ